MGKQSEIDDNVSWSDQVSHNMVSSVSDNKTGKQNSRDADVSTVSSERPHSANHTFVRSDVSSETALTSNEKRKNPSEGEDSTAVVLHPHKQLKADSSLSKNNLNECSYSTRSAESKKMFQEFDLNEGVEADDASVYELNYLSHDLSRPIPVVAKVGVPSGFPKKPLQFDGELGWKRSGIPSAFQPTPHKNSEIEKAPIPRGFDLNVAAIDLELSDDKAPTRSTTLSIDLNQNPAIEDPYKSVYSQGETRQLLRNFDTFGTVSPNASFPRIPYWVDMNPVRGYGPLVQGQPFLLGAPTTEQVQMIVPIQFTNTPPGLYIGKVNSNLTPAFYPHNVLPPVVQQQMPGSTVLATYPGNIQLLENSQANMRQAILSNGSRVNYPAENLMHVRNHLFEERMNAVDNGGWGSSQLNSRQMNSWNKGDY